MTRRIIAYRTASSYLFSQEFNGDREEAIRFKKKLQEFPLIHVGDELPDLPG